MVYHDGSRNTDRTERARRVQAHLSTPGEHTHSYTDVGHTTVALCETLDILADFDSDSHGLMTRDELR